MTSVSAPTATAAELPPRFKRRLLMHLLPEVGPLLLFFLAFMWKDLIFATAIYAVATAAAFAVTWARHRRLPVLPLVSTLLVVIFAGLTLALGEAMFIKMKPTVLNGFYAAVLGLGWLFGYRLIERILEPECRLDEEGLRALTLRTSGYLLSLAIINEIIWRTMPTEHWVLFKVFIMVAFNLTFAWAQLPLLRRHLIVDEGTRRAGKRSTAG